MSIQKLRSSRIASAMMLLTFLWAPLAQAAELESGTVTARQPDAPSLPILRVEPGGPTAAISQVVFVNDHLLASVGFDKAIRLWNLDTQQQAGLPLRGPIGMGITGLLWTAAASTDLATGDPVLAVAGYDQSQPQYPGDTKGTGEQTAQFNVIRVFDLKTGKIARTLPGHDNLVSSLAFSTDGRLLVSGGTDTAVIVWDMRTGKAVAKVVPTGSQARLPISVAFSPDGSQIAACAMNQPVDIWNIRGLQTGQKPVRTIKCQARVLAWSEAGLATASGVPGDTAVHLWDPANGRELKHFDEAANSYSIAFSPDGSKLVSASGGEEGRGQPEVKTWSVDDGNPLQSFQKHVRSVHTVAFSPNGKQVASGDEQGRIYVWDAAAGTVKDRLTGTGETPVRVAWSPDGQSLAWATDANTKQFQHAYDFGSGVMGADPDPNGNWKGPIAQNRGRTLSLAPDRRGVLVNGKDEIKLWDLNDEIPKDRDSFTFTTDGNGIIIGSQYHLTLYNLQGEIVRNFVGHDGAIWSVSIGGKYLASAADDQTIRVWNLEDDEKVVSPLLSIFRASNGQWVSWTHKGYYNTSNLGDSLIGWQLNRGPDEAAEYYSADQFRKIYYRPDVIAALPKAGSVDEAVRIADNNIKPPEVIKPPQIAIVSPDQGSSTESNIVTVQAKITDPGNRAINKVNISLNNREMPLTSEQAVPDADGNWKASVTLASEGDNTLAVRATNDAGVVSDEKSVTIQYRPPQAPIIELLNNAGANPVYQPLVPLKATITTAAPHKIVSVFLTINGEQSDASLPAADGAWSQPASLTRNGANKLTIRAISDAGVEASKTFSITYQAAQAPLVTIDSPTAAPTTNPSVSVQASIKDPLNLPLSRVSLLLNGREIAQQGAAELNGLAGAWTHPATLSKGDNTLTVRATNSAGATGEQTITVNYREPQRAQVEILSPVGGMNITQNQVPVKVHIVNPDNRTITRVLLLVNGKLVGSSDALPEGNLWNRTAPLSEGDNTILVRVVDDTGLQSEATVVVRSQAPAPPAPKPLQIRITSPSAAAPLTVGQVQVKALITSPDGHHASKAYLTLNGRDLPPAVVNNDTVIAPVTLPEGQSDLVLHVISEVGIQSEARFKLIYQLPKPPLVELLSPNQNQRFTQSQAPVTLSVTDPGGHAIAAVTLRSNQQEISRVTAADANGQWRLQAPLKDGENDFTIQAVNDAGIQSQPLILKLLKTTPKIPTIQIISPVVDENSTATVNDSLINIQAKVVDPDNPNAVPTVTVTVNNHARDARDLVEVPHGPENWNWGQRVNVKDGTNTVTVHAKTASGAEAEQVLVIIYHKPLPPKVEILSPGPGGPVITQDQVPVKIHIDSAGRGIKQVTFFVNGQAVNGISREAGEWQQAVPLVSGSNTIKVQVVNDASLEGYSPQITIQCNPPKPTPVDPVQDVSKFKPPTVEILSPQDGYTATEASLDIKAQVADPNNRKVTLAVELNGKPVTTRDLEELQSSGVVAAATGEQCSLKNIALQNGENDLAITATNDARVKSKPVQIKVFFKPHTTNVETGTLYVLSIGVAKYKNTAYTLEYPAKDARDFAAVWTSQKGRMFHDVKSIVLADTDASRSGIDNALDDIGNKMTKGDTAIVFVSGHGVVDKGVYYYAPYDFDLDRPKSTGVAWTDFNNTLQQLPGTCMLVLDTCHAAAAEVNNNYTAALQNAENAMITFASCVPAQKSLENAQWNNGAFTKALIEGLQGAADLNHDGTITFDELAAFVTQRVSDLTEGRQTPTCNHPLTISGLKKLAVL